VVESTVLTVAVFGTDLAILFISTITQKVVDEFFHKIWVYCGYVLEG